jgi:hypothetical protein
MKVRLFQKWRGYSIEPPKTALVAHILDHEANDTVVAAHNTFNFADVQILNQETNNQKRKLTEA